jgi:hypothetical protein
MYHLVPTPQLNLASSFFFQLFSRLKEENPDFESRVVHIQGDTRETDLGLDEEDYQLLVNEVAFSNTIRGFTRLSITTKHN